MIIDVSKERMVGLDVFRILAVLFVFLFHSRIHHGCNYGFLNDFIQMGAVFMTGFFMLSGFVLHATYKSQVLSEFPNLRKFYLKRIAGILPLYYLVALVYILTFGTESTLENLVLLPIEALGLQSVFSSLFEVSHNNGTWFISCLLLCYLVFPLLHEIAKHISPKLKVIFVLVCTLILLWSPLIVHFFKTDSIYSNPFFRILEFFIGILLCSLCQGINLHSKKWLFCWPTFFIEFVILAGGISLCVHHNLFVGNFMLYNWIALPCFALMLLTLSKITTPWLTKSKVLRYLSALSFAFFIAQTLNTDIENALFQKFAIDGNLPKILISFGVCFLLAFLLHEVVEKPISRYLRKKIN
ncbi:MAG: acyltransferase [Fibrobacter sp.]|nr:acyltransferase [Fibrobacter sp.]